MRKATWLPITLAIAATPAAAHEEAEPWPGLSITIPVARRWNVTGEVVKRVAADDERDSQLVLRGLVGYALTPRLTVAAGYVRTDTQSTDAATTTEHRVMEQAIWNAGVVLGVRVGLRTRLEQRFLPGVDPVTWRAREQVRLTLPLAPRGPSAVAWAEAFVGLNHTVRRDTLEQSRAFAGVSLPVTRHAAFEIGYLSQDFFRPGKNVHNDVIPLIVNVRF